MRNKYYDANRFLRIKKLVHNYYFEQAISEYEKYLEEYPNDCCCSAYYADALIKFGDLDKAQEVLDNVIITSKTPKLSCDDLIIMRIKLLCCQKKYRECYELLGENFSIFDERNIEITEVLIFLKKQLGLLAVKDYGNYSYKIEQIVSYSEERAISCIRYCHFGPEKELTYCFDESFKLVEFYKKVRELIPRDNVINETLIENSYIFKYEECGRVDGKAVDYVQVIALQGSNDIITMYPYDNKAKLPCLDLTPERPKIKRMSQIDKFNQRYNK